MSMLQFHSLNNLAILVSAIILWVLGAVWYSPPLFAKPWMELAGIYDLNDPVVQDWIETMAENRRKADEDPDYP